MVANTTTQRHIAEGIRTRDGVVRPDRIPQSEMDSWDKPVGPDKEYALGDGVADPRAEESFSQVEFVADMVKLIEGLTAEQRRLLQNTITGDRTQAELGKLLGITDRAVRMRLAALQAWMRAQRDAPDTPPHPPQAPGEGGGSAGGEEGQS